MPVIPYLLTRFTTGILFFCITGPMYDYTIKIGTQDPSVEANRDNAQGKTTIL